MTFFKKDSNLRLFLAVVFDDIFLFQRTFYNKREEKITQKNVFSLCHFDEKKQNTCLFYTERKSNL
jgi:hypothetical protein